MEKKKHSPADNAKYKRIQIEKTFSKPKLKFGRFILYLYCFFFCRSFSVEI